MINILPEDLINQIAAGEVIENPASVVKELVENSLDANATKVTIKVQNYGLKKIIVEDNGIGIKKNDLKKAPLRHATSKIKTIHDLYKISTLGFRGEALASIFSISKAKIYSRVKNEKGYEIDNSLTIKEKEGPIGTIVTVEDIFYNTPARKKYLKSELTEFRELLEIVKKFAIIHYEVSFKLFHNNKLIFSKPVTNTLKENIQIIEKEVKNKLINIEQHNIIKIEGVISKPELTFSTKKKQYIYVNKRLVKSKLIENAIYDAINHKLLGKHPFFVINLTVEPDLVDVNIHPKKIEVKFESENLVYKEVKEAITKALREQEEIRSITFQKKLTNISTPKKREEKELIKSFQKELVIREESETYISLPMTSNTENEIKKEGKLYNELKEYKIIGQIKRKYILIETLDSIYLIDQHVVEEKYFYEKLKNREFKIHRLVIPYQLKLTPEEEILLKETIKTLKSYGFKIEGNKITEVPIVEGQVLDPSIITEIIHNEKKFRESLLENIATKACKMSIKAGKELTRYEMKRLIEILRTLDDPYTCPHGRPIIIRIPFREIDKWFKRI